MTAESITQFAVHVGLFVLAVSFLLTARRVIVGPTLPDRVIALDMLVGIVMGFIALIAIRTGFTLYIDIAISLGLVGFLATVAFARFILSRKARAGEDGTLPLKAPSAPAPTATRPPPPRMKTAKTKKIDASVAASDADQSAPAEAKKPRSRASKRKEEKLKPAKGVKRGEM